jgi:hypothetical protein
VRLLLTSSAVRQRLAEGALNWSAKFDWDTTAQGLLSVLSSICAQPQVADLPVASDVPAPHP